MAAQLLSDEVGIAVLMSAQKAPPPLAARHLLGPALKFKPKSSFSPLFHPSHFSSVQESLSQTISTQKTHDDLQGMPGRH